MFESIPIGNIKKSSARAEEQFKTNNPKSPNQTTINLEQYTDFTQIIPSNVTSETYSADVICLVDSMRSLLPEWPQEYDLSSSPYPIYTPEHRMLELQALYNALYPCLLGILRAWWTRPEFYTSIPIPAKIERVLKKLDVVRKFDAPGCIRPDFIVPEGDGAALTICEINARFMFNGYFTSVLLAEGTESAIDSDATWYQHDRFSIGMTLQGLKDILKPLYDAEKPIALVIDREKPWDLAVAKNLHPNARFVAPSDLHIINTPANTQSSGSATLADSHGPLEQFFVELHQDEIEAMDEGVLFELGKRCWNDLRTIYLIHDKRMLAVIRRELGWCVDNGIITAEQAEILRKGLAETYLLDDTTYSTILATMRPGDKDQWTLKKARSGKGEGMILGKNVDEETWKAWIEKYRAGKADAEKTQEEQASSYVLQKYVESKRLDLLVHNPASAREAKKTNGTVTMEKMRWKIVGMMLCIGDIFIPNSAWRANRTDIVALGRAGSAFAGVGDNGYMGSFKVQKAAQQNLVNSHKAREDHEKEQEASVKPEDTKPLQRNEVLPPIR